MSNVVVYKTDIADRNTADRIIDAIHHLVPGCEASFDLDDCDNVLRIKFTNGNQKMEGITGIIENYGYQIENLL